MHFLPPLHGEGAEPQAKRVGAPSALVAEPSPPGRRFAPTALPMKGRENAAGRLPSSNPLPPRMNAG